MTWLSRLRTYLGYDERVEYTDNSASPQRARRALDDAQTALDEAQQRREEVKEVTQSLAKLRARNHFGESIQIAMMRREKHV